MQDSAYLRPADAARFIGIGLSTLWRYLANSDKTGFPRPKKVSERVTVFKRTDLEAWVESRSAESGTTPVKA